MECKTQALHMRWALYKYPITGLQTGGEANEWSDTDSKRHLHRLKSCKAFAYSLLDGWELLLFQLKYLQKNAMDAKPKFRLKATQYDSEMTSLESTLSILFWWVGAQKMWEL